MRKQAGESGEGAPHVLPSAKVVTFPRIGGSVRVRNRAAKPSLESLILSKSTARKLELPLGKTDHVYWDSQLKGFGLRLRGGGKRTWFVQFRDPSGATRKITIGSVDVVDADEARAAAKKLLGGVATGNDPAKAKREARAASRMGELLSPFLAHAAKKQRPSTLEATTRNLRTHAKSLHGYAVRDIGRVAIAELHDKVTAKSGPVQANRVLAALSGFFAWAIGRGQLDLNPVLAVPKHPEEARDRTLSDDEIKTIWNGTASGSDYDRIVRLLLVTGTRRGEVGSMRWDELTETPAGRLWKVPGERMKNGEPHTVPLTELASAAFPVARTGSPYVFGKTANAGYSGWSRSRSRLDSRLKLAPWILHDFRRTLSTRLHEACVPPHIVEAVLAHSSHKQGVAGVYNQAAYDGPKREALQLWAGMISKIVKAKDNAGE